MTQTDQQQQQPQQTVVVNQPRQSQALPALINIFFPGVGQLIQGRVLTWLAVWALFALCNIIGIVTMATEGAQGLGLAMLLIGNPLLWLITIIDAAKWSPK